MPPIKRNALRVIAATALAWGVAIAAVYAASEVPQSAEPAALEVIAGMCLEI